MPEGDTVHKIARALRPQLEGARLERLWLRDEGGAVAALAGARVEEVVALGKHLLVALAPRGGGGDRVLHVHLGMHGRWRRLEPGAAVGAAPRLRIETAAARFACFRAPVVELMPRAHLRGHPVLARLGPDLLAEDFDPAAIVARARRRDPATVAELLLDQTVACGLGNVYKSELLFLEGIGPRAQPRALADERLAALYRRGRELLLANLGGWRRTTTRPVRPGEPWLPGAPRLWVYGRHGQPCLRCGAPIAVARQGDAARATWWCPRCQRESEGR
jgi:endonuclease-8